jgi:diketogulonate reductase-like aldo/keto reductase
MFAAPSGASAFAATETAPNTAARTVKFHDGPVVPAIGQGSAQLAQGRHPEAIEEEALRTGLSLGMTAIDTAEIYGNGRSEKLIGHVIAGRRDRVFLVSKVWPNHVTGNGIARACAASLARLGTDYLDRRRVRKPARGGQDSRLGRVQFQCPPNGRPPAGSGRSTLRNQSGPLQRGEPRHRA